MMGIQELSPLLFFPTQLNILSSHKKYVKSKATKEPGRVSYCTALVGETSPGPCIADIADACWTRSWKRITECSFPIKQ